MSVLGEGGIASGQSSERRGTDDPYELSLWVLRPRWIATGGQTELGFWGCRCWRQRSAAAVVAHYIEMTVCLKGSFLCRYPLMAMKGGVGKQRSKAGGGKTSLLLPQANSGQDVSRQLQSFQKLPTTFSSSTISSRKLLMAISLYIVELLISQKLEYAPCYIPFIYTSVPLLSFTTQKC